MDIVTGAFGYIGSYIARELLSQGREVRTVTTHYRRTHVLSDAVQAFPYSFDPSSEYFSDVLSVLLPATFYLPGMNCAG